MADEASGKIPTAGHEVIVLDEVLSGGMFENNRLLKALQDMLMTASRSIFVALLGSQFTTSDRRLTFAKSVNLVADSNDLGTISTILKYSIADN